MELDGPRQWIEAAAKETGVLVSVPSEDEAARVLRLILDRFVATDTLRWWWQALRLPCRTFDRRTVRIADLTPSLEGDVFLIPESFETGLIYQLAGERVEQLLNECPLFEYTIVDYACTWFLSENHHDVIFLCEWEESAASGR